MCMFLWIGLTKLLQITNYLLNLISNCLFLLQLSFRAVISLRDRRLNELKAMLGVAEEGTPEPCVTRLLAAATRVLHSTAHSFPLGEAERTVINQVSRLITCVDGGIGAVIENSYFQRKAHYNFIFTNATRRYEKKKLNYWNWTALYSSIAVQYELVLILLVTMGSVHCLPIPYTVLCTPIKNVSYCFGILNVS